MDFEMEDYVILTVCGSFAFASVIALCIYVFWYARKRLKRRATDVEADFDCQKRELDKERTEKQTALKELQSLESAYNVLMNKHVAIEQNLRQETNAKDEALTRLSEKISRNLTDNNPNIADLSDTNRPTNLVDKFSSLYDDGWTEAFDGCQKILGYGDDKKVIQQLLEILMDCFQICRDISAKQLASGLRLGDSNILIDKLPTEMKKIIKYTRKKMYDADLPMIHERIRNKFQNDRKDVLQSEQVEKYARRCTEISWLMAIQDPPMAILTEVGEDFKYNKSRYREYTKQGEFVDYVVWPAVLIQDGGQLMSKGIVQCRDERLIVL